MALVDTLLLSIILYHIDSPEVNATDLEIVCCISL